MWSGVCGHGFTSWREEDEREEDEREEDGVSVCTFGYARRVEDEFAQDEAEEDEREEDEREGRSSS
jgi:hypothetical protein